MIAITRATHWSPEVAAVAYDWLLDVGQYVPRLFEHFRIEDGQRAEIVLVPSTVDQTSRTDPDRFAKRWQAARAEESAAVFFAAEPMDPARFADRRPSSRQQHEFGELREDALTYDLDIPPRDHGEVIAERSYLSRGWIFFKTHSLARNTAFASGLLIAFVVVLNNILPASRDYETEVNDLQSQLSDVTSELESLRSENESLASELDALRAARAEEAAAAPEGLREGTVEAVKNQLSSALDKASQTVDRLAALKREPDALAEAMTTLKGEVQGIVDSVQAAANELGLELRRLEPAAGPATGE